MSDELLTMGEAKKLGLSAAGRRFKNPKGAIGTVLDHVNERGYVQAAFSCTTPDCSRVHVRGMADWHAVGKCELHGAKSGTVAHPKLKIILPGDDAETVALKEQFNRAVRDQRARDAALRKRKAAKELIRKQLAVLVGDSALACAHEVAASESEKAEQVAAEVTRE